MLPHTPDQILDVRSLPGTRELMAYKDGGLFPVLSLAPGGVVVAAVRGGAGHLGLDGRIDIIRSLDGGLTWTPPSVVADSDRDDRNPGMGLSHKGTLILAYHRQGGYDEAGNNLGPEARGPERVELMTTRSSDAGLTWQPPVPLNVECLSAGSAFGKIIALDDNTLIMPIYARPVDSLINSRTPPVPSHGRCSYIVRSRDDGQTWEEPSLIAVNVNETALLGLPEGDIVAVMRGQDPQTALHCARSSDGGYTWSEPVQITEPRHHPADLIRLANGEILLTYGVRTPPHRIAGRVSRDGGRSWLDLLLVFSGPLFGYATNPTRLRDMGYPSSVVLRTAGSGQGITMYYYNPSAKRIPELYKRAGNDIYLARDYCAIAVIWKEEELLTGIDRLLK